MDALTNVQFIDFYFEKTYRYLCGWLHKCFATTNPHMHSLARAFPDDLCYLGITITDNMDWGQHVSEISSKATKTLDFLRRNHTSQCKRTGGCYNELVVAFFSTGGDVKGKKNLYLLTLLFIYKLAFILFVMTPGAQTTGNIAVYGSAKQLVI